MLSTYRYHLRREVPGNHPLATSYCFIGVNPSTATDDVDDATVRKWTGFVQRWGGGSFTVVNLFAFRATDVRLLALAPDPVGPDNDRHILEHVRHANVVVPCWGRASKLPPGLRVRIDDVVSVLAHELVTTRCLGRTQDGQPRHPLMLPYDTQLEDFF